MRIIKKDYNDSIEMFGETSLESAKESQEILRRKLLSMISMSKAAGHLFYGFDSVRNTIKNNSSRLLMVTTDLSENTKEEIIFLATKHEVDYLIVPFTMEEMKQEIGKKVGVLSVADVGLASSVLKNYNNWKQI